MRFKSIIDAHCLPTVKFAFHSNRPVLATTSDTVLNSSFSSGITNVIKVWDVRSKDYSPVQFPCIASVSLRQQCRCLLYNVQFLAVSSADDCVYVYDANSMKLKAKFKVSGAAMAWHTKRPLLFVGGFDANPSILIFDMDQLNNKQPVMTLKGHTERVSANGILALTSKLLITGSEDHTIRVWNLRSGKQSQRITLPNAVTSLCTLHFHIPHTAVMFLSGCCDGFVHIFRQNNAKHSVFSKVFKIPIGSLNFGICSVPLRSAHALIIICDKDKFHFYILG